MVLLNGFLAPLRESYSPGEQINLFCNEGYAAEIALLPDTEASKEQDSNSTKVSNKHTFECSSNGTWRLIIQSTESISNLEINRAPVCKSLKSLQSKIKSALQLSDPNPYNYVELNLRSAFLIFTVGGVLIILLVFSLLVVKFFSSRLSYLNYGNNYASNSFLVANECPNINDNITTQSSPSNLQNVNVISNSTTTAGLSSIAFGSIGSSTSLNQRSLPNANNHISSLPSYEEAVNSFNCSNNNNINISLGQPQQLGLGLGFSVIQSPQTRSQPTANLTLASDILRSNPQNVARNLPDNGTVSNFNSAEFRLRCGSINSTNPNIQAAIAPETTRNFSNSSFNLQSRKNARRSNHFNQNQLRRPCLNSNRPSNNNPITSSSLLNEDGLSESPTVSTIATTSSDDSNKSNASKITLRGSNSAISNDSVSLTLTNADDQSFLLDNIHNSID